MKNIPVSSKIIKSMYFDPQDGKLRLCFANGEERLFAGVPEDKVSEMATAQSPGNYYISEIRSRYNRLAA